MRNDLPATARRTGLCFMTALACAALSIGASPAWADNTPEAADAAIAAIQDVSPEVLVDAVTGNASAEDAITYDTDIASVSVPHDPSDDALLTSPNAEVGLEFPFSEEADASIDENGQVIYDNQNFSVTVPVVHEEGSLQVLTVIEGPSAPQRYAYDLKVSPGSSVIPAEDGTILITNADGGFAGLILPAWAKDANGAAVETWYEVSGTTVTQVVIHSSDTQYPVIADPWLGITLFSNFSRDTYNGDYRYNGYVTVAGSIILSGGGGVGGLVAGIAVFTNEGWAEWTARWSAITNKATLVQQYRCHVSAGVYGLPFTGAYNLERFRTNRSYWSTDVLSHHCNW